MSRLGQTTWQASLSQEALKIMVTELKRVADDKTCVVVYDTSDRAPRKVIHIGNTNRYTPDGDFAFSVHQQPAIAVHNQSGLARIMAKSCVLAGLLHDLGKGTERFQEKLKYGVTKNKGLSDPIRHEIVSVLMAGPLLQAMAQMSKEQDIASWCNQHMQAVLDAFQANDQRTPYQRSQEIAKHLQTGIFHPLHWAKQSLLETSINWLVLSHHRLPDGALCSTDGIIPSPSFGGKFNYFLKVVETASSIGESDSTHVEKERFNKKDFNENLSLCRVTDSMESIRQPWDDKTWRVKVFECYQRLTRLKAEYEHLLPDNALKDDNAWATGLALMGRPALVYADYMISFEKKPSGRSRKKGTIYANTTMVDNEAQYADSLESHLIGVGDRAGKYCADLFIRRNGLTHNFPTLSSDERNVLLPGLNKKTASDPRYHWQDVVLSSLKPLRSNTPFFASVMGKTGAGKTRGNFMLMHALKEDLRFTCAIGLRSLVKQTYAAYQDPFIGLTEDHVALLIGESQGQSEKLPSEASGTGNDLQEDEQLLLGDYILNGNTVFEHSLGEIFDGKKQRAMLANPIQVMTVDHIMPGASLGRSSELKLLLHLMGTDIVLDEIDDYSVSSQAALMRMAFISGVFGRSFVLSSATATPIIQKAFFNAWSHGYRHHRKLFQFGETDVEAFGVLVSHVQGSEVVRTSLDGFEAGCDLFVRQVVADASQPVHVNHRLAVATMSCKSTSEAIQGPLAGLYSNSNGLSFPQHQELLATILEAHKQHAVTQDGVRLSSGFVRFSNIHNAQQLAQALDAWSDDSLYIVPLCYHSAMTFMDRLSIEALLNTLNCRKDLAGVRGDLRIFQHPFAKRAVDEALAAGKHDVVFVLCTTNIIEVGRDHDYDWAILEPSSTRSLVQSCGRIWRHRVKSLAEDSNNVWILPMTVKALANQENEEWKTSTKRLWKAHGIEDDASIALRFPLTQESSRALSKLGISQVGIPQSPQRRTARPGRGGSSGQMEQAVLSSDRLWTKAVSHQMVHAGLCLEIPEDVVGSLMTALEFAQQEINLNGIEAQGSLFAFEQPSGLDYAEYASQRLTSNHPTRRRLRDSEEGYSLNFDTRVSDVAADGFPTDQWHAQDKDGNIGNVRLEVERHAPGRLFVPPSLSEYMNDHPELSSKMLTELGLRKDQYEALSEGKLCYKIGLGLCRIS